ncbi:MAG: ATP-binding cassette domain-containing protein, partial [Deinococcus sp.]|nr:ATP-binding cassette domain-containing protein [Deinococcus sp.]
MIQVRHLTKVYPDGTRALDDVSVDIQDGEFVSIIGLSGAGKSTFLRCLNGLVQPTQGSIKIDGQEVAGASEHTLRLVRKKMGFIFQQFNLVTRLNVLQNVLTGRLGYRSTHSGLLGLFAVSDRQIALDYIQRVGLAEKVFTRASHLSGGQQ